MVDISTRQLTLMGHWGRTQCADRPKVNRDCALILHVVHCTSFVQHLRYKYSFQAKRGILLFILQPDIYLLLIAEISLKTFLC